MDYYVHETAIVDSGASIGKGTKIWHWVHITDQADIGVEVTIGQNVYVGKAKIGNRVKIQNNVSVYDNVCLEDEVFCGPSMVFTNVTTPRAHINRKSEYKGTLVKKGATLGANCTIVCGNTIGQYSMIGAGSVVTGDIPDYALYVGVPARQTGWVCACGEKLDVGTDDERSNVKCHACNKVFQIKNGSCIDVSA